MSSNASKDQEESIFDCAHRSQAMLQMFSDLFKMELPALPSTCLSQSADSYILNRMDTLHSLGHNRFLYLFKLIWELHERIVELEERAHKHEIYKA